MAPGAWLLRRAAARGPAWAKPKIFLKNGLVRYKWKYGKSAGDLPLCLSNFHVDETPFWKLDVLSTQSTVSFCKTPSDLRNDLRNSLRRNLRCHSDTDRNDKSFGGVGARLGGVSVGGAAVSFEFRVLGFELRKNAKAYGKRFFGGFLTF